MAKESTQGIDRKCVFRCGFQDEATVRAQGGTPNNVTFSNGVAGFNGTNSLILKTLNYNTNAISFRLKIYANSTIDLNRRGLVGDKLSAGAYTALTFNGTNFSYYNQTGTERAFSSSYSKNTWYDAVFVLASGSQKLYVNGVLDGTSFVDGISYFNIKCIGNIDSDLGVNRPFDGLMEFFEVYNYALTAEEVKNLYNNSIYRDIQLNKNEQLGPELVVNGGFDTDTDWTKSGGSWTISGGKANYDDLNNHYINPTIAVPFTIGKRYRFSYTISGVTGTASISLVNQNSSACFDLYPGYVTRANGSYSELLLCTASATSFRFHANTASGSAFSIDNFSIKEVLVESTRTILDVCCGINKLSGNTIEGNLVPSTINTSVLLQKDGDVNAMLFNGSTSKIDCGSYDTLVGDKTFVAWIKSNALTKWKRICSNGSFIILSQGDTKKIGFTSTSSLTWSYCADNVWKLDQWFLLTITRTSTGITNFYINSVLSGTANQTSGTPTAGTGVFTIGMDSGAITNQYKGCLDKVRIVNGILTPTEISNLFTAERQKYNV